MPEFNDYTLTTLSSSIEAVPPGVTATDIIGAGVVTGSSANLPIGFDFVFHDRVHTQFRAFSSGFVQLISDGGSLFADSESGDNNDLYTHGKALADPILAPWWNELKTNDLSGAGFVRYWNDPRLRVGNRKLVVDFRCYEGSNQTSSDYSLLNFQVVLYEKGNVIQFKYAPITDFAGTC